MIFLQIRGTLPFLKKGAKIIKMQKISIVLISLATVCHTMAYPYTNNVDGRVYDISGGKYSYSSWVFNDDMGYMGTTNVLGVGNFSHSSFNNNAHFSNAQEQRRPSTVIISHSSGTINISGIDYLIATHSAFENSSFNAGEADLSYSVLNNCNISRADLSFSDITDSTVNHWAIFYNTHVQGAIINSSIVSSCLLYTSPSPRDRG